MVRSKDAGRRAHCATCRCCARVLCVLSAQPRQGAHERRQAPLSQRCHASQGAAAKDTEMLPSPSRPARTDTFGPNLGTESCSSSGGTRSASSRLLARQSGGAKTAAQCPQKGSCRIGAKNWGSCIHGYNKSDMIFGMVDKGKGSRKLKTSLAKQAADVKDADEEVRDEEVRGSAALLTSNHTRLLRRPSKSGCLSLCVT